MKRKGQAAMEFLMTYGWAILAAIIVIGVLAVFFRPSGFGTTPSRLNPPLYLIAANIDGATPQVNLEFRNDASDGISIAVGGFKACLDSTCAINCVNAAVIPNLAVGTSSGLVVLDNCAGTITADVDYQGDFIVDYTLGAAAVTNRVTGTIAGTAQ